MSDAAQLQFSNPFARILITRQLQDIGESGALWAPPASAIAADGESAAVVVFRTRSKTPVQFSLAADAPATLSAYKADFLSAPQAGTAKSVTVSTFFDWGEESIALALLWSPKKMPFAATELAACRTDAAQCRLSQQLVTVTATQAGTLTRAAIAIVPPPVALIHGVWSDGSAWNELRSYLSTSSYPQRVVRTVDYRRFNYLSFSDAELQSTIQTSIWNILAEASDSGIVARRVDVVGHSMGGLATRYMLTNAAGLVKSSVNSLITVGTPHLGSRLAPVLYAKRNSPPLSVLLNPLARAACSAFRAPVCTLGFLFEKSNHRIDTGVESLIPESEPLGRLGGATNYRSIVGIAPTLSGTESMLNALIDQFVKTDIDTQLGSRNDTIVGEGSQNYLAAETATFDGVVHANLASDPSETNSRAIFHQILYWLLGGAGRVSSGASASTVKNAPRLADMPLPDLTLNGKTEVPASNVVWTPATATALPAHTAFTISASSPTKTIAQVFLLQNVAGADSPGLLYATTVPFSIPFTPSRLGMIEFAAFTVFTDNTFAVTPLSYNVVAPGSVLSLELTNAPVAALSEGASAHVRSWAAFGSGAVEVSGQAVYRARSGTSHVFSIAAGGVITAVGAGADWLDVSYGGVTVSKLIRVGNCSFALTPAVQVVSPAGGSASIQVQTEAGCRWTLAVDDNWLTALPLSGNGSGAVNFTVAANAAAQGARSGALRIANSVAAITQPGSECSYSVSPASAAVPAAGASGSVTVTSTCPFVTSSTADWLIPLTLESSVAYQALANPGTAPRSAQFSVGTAKVTINQQGLASSSLGISGRVTIAGNALTGAVVSLSGSQAATVKSDASGRFSFTGLSAGGSYQLTATRAGHTLSPPVRTFSNLQTIVTDADFAAMPAADLNGDGRLDLFLYDPAGHGYAALSAGAGALSYVYTPFTPQLNTLRLADINADGRSDLAIYNSANGLGYIGTGAGNGTFNFASLFWGPGFDHITSGDWNNDGKADFILHRSSDGTTYTAISNGSGGFTYRYSLVSIGFTHLLVGDFNGDRRSDVLFYRSSDGACYRGLSDGSGAFTFASVMVGAGYDRLDTGDIDGDGNLDVLFYSSADGRARIGVSLGAAFVLASATWSPGFTTARLADVNGDGKSDIVLYNKTNTLGYLGLGTGNAQFNFSSVFWGAGMETVAAGDWNGDGRQDFVIYNASNGAAYMCQSTGNPAVPFTYTYHYWGLGRLAAR